MNSVKLFEAKKEIDNNNLNLKQYYSINLTPKSLLDGIILSEILGEPKARKGLMSNNVYKSVNSR
ncbi:hypothetical protein [Proteiniborus sp.]|uniref:hypothetical protein n=1 Tax=Proteiniborus sp. TaxID=2079015 RepID=UPI0033187141